MMKPNKGVNALDQLPREGYGKEKGEAMPYKLASSDTFQQATTWGGHRGMTLENE